MTAPTQTELDAVKFRVSTELYRKQYEIGKLSAEIARKEKLIAQMDKNIAAIKSGKLDRLAEVKVLPGMSAKAVAMLKKFTAIHAEATELKKYDCRKLGINPNHYRRS
jgi:hypothetical protein